MSNLKVELIEFDNSGSILNSSKREIAGVTPDIFEVIATIGEALLGMGFVKESILDGFRYWIEEHEK